MMFFNFCDHIIMIFEAVTIIVDIDKTFLIE